MAARILVVSPIPSHPQDQGNSARIYAVGRALQTAGFIVHFLYYQMEGLTPAQLAGMQASWDFVHPVPCPARDMSPTGPGSYALDDWYDERVSEVAGDLHRRYRFQAVLVNYVWFSAVLDAFGPEIVKILDTHDVFGGRDQRFREIGMEPEWFFTTEDEESRGLSRADVVLAIQDDEAVHFKNLGHSDVRILGHLLGQRRRAPRRRGLEPVRVGYLASGNPLNTTSFSAMRQRLLGERPRSALAFMVAGSICDKLAQAAEPFTVVGRVGHVDDFYDRVDLVVNPMHVGTGLKIKSVEAVFDGLPLIATVAAMKGLPVCHRLHECDGPEDVAARILAETIDDKLITELHVASTLCADAYSAQVRAAFRALAATVGP